MGCPREPKSRREGECADDDVSGRHIRTAERPDDLGTEENLQCEETDQRGGGSAHGQRGSAVAADENDEDGQRNGEHESHAAMRELECNAEIPLGRQQRVLRGGVGEEGDGEAGVVVTNKHRDGQLHEQQGGADESGAAHAGADREGLLNP